MEYYVYVYLFCLRYFFYECFFIFFFFLIIRRPPSSTLTDTTLPLHVALPIFRERGDEVRLLDIWADPSRPKDIAFINSSVLDRDGVAAAMRDVDVRSEEHTSELQSLMRISYAVFCLKKKK